MKIKNVKQINVSDWDDLVIETYGKPYNFQQQDGCKDRGSENINTNEDWEEDFENNTVPEIINGEEMGVSFKAWLERNPDEWNGQLKDKDFIDLWWERNFYPHVSMIAKDLHAKGLLEAGEYEIKIDW